MPNEPPYRSGHSWLPEAMRWGEYRLARDGILGPNSREAGKHVAKNGKSYRPKADS